MTPAQLRALIDAAQVPPSDAEIESAIDAFRDACHRHAREAVLGADDDEPSAAVAAKDAREALVSIMRRYRPDGLLRAASNALRCVEWNAGMWGEPPKPCVRLSRAAFDDLRAEVARVEGK